MKQKKQARQRRIRIAKAPASCFLKFVRHAQLNADSTILLKLITSDGGLYEKRDGARSQTGPGENELGSLNYPLGDRCAGSDATLCGDGERWFHYREDGAGRTD